MSRIYIIEDEPILRDLFQEYLLASDLDITIVGSSGNGQEALAECIELKPDIALVDIRLPEVNGLEILHILKMRVPETKVLIFTGSTNTNAVRIAVEGKADGFIEKAAGLEQLVDAVKTVTRGEHYYSPAVYRQILTFKTTGV
ncbi:MAG: response regulator transcription factor [Opitutales bacterium]|nr:response regulator transcription factor [Opitutales bacterium]NRA25811.1 response regulator transcription factor [Opitutales bacterium]